MAKLWWIRETLPPQFSKQVVVIAIVFTDWQHTLYIPINITFLCVSISWKRKQVSFLESYSSKVHALMTAECLDFPSLTTWQDARPLTTTHISKDQKKILPYYVRHHHHHHHCPYLRPHPTLYPHPHHQTHYIRLYWDIACKRILVGSLKCYEKKCNVRIRIHLSNHSMIQSNQSCTVPSNTSGAIHAALPLLFVISVCWLQAVPKSQIFRDVPHLSSNKLDRTGKYSKKELWLHM